MRYIRSSFWKKCVLCILVSSLFIVFLMTGWFYHIYSDQMKRELQRVTQAMLTQISVHTQQVCQQATAIGTDLLSDSEVMEFMLLEKKDPLLESALKRKLNSNYLASANVDSIFLYNGMLNRYLNSLGVHYPPDEALTELINADNGVGAAVTDLVPRVYYERDMYGQIRSNKEHRVITYVVYPSNLRLREGRYAIAVNVDAEYLLSQTVGSMNLINGECGILNESGVSLVDSPLGAFCEDLSQQDYVARILESNAPSGSFMETVNDRMSMVVYVRSSGDDGWLFLSVIDAAHLYPQMDAIRSRVLIALLAMAIFALTLSWMMSGALYKPVHRVVHRMGVDLREKVVGDEFRMIENSFSDVQQSMERMRLQFEASSMRLCLRMLMMGENPDNPHYEQPLKRIMDAGSAYAVLILEPDETPDSMLDGEVLTWTIQRTFGGKAVFADRQQERFVLLLCMEEELPRKAAGECLKSASNELVQNGWRCRMGMGICVRTLEEISDSYQTAQDALNYMFMMEDRTILWNDVAWREELLYDYPAKEERQLVEAVRMGNVGKCEEALKEVEHQLCQTSYQTAKLVPSQMMLTLLRECGIDDDFGEMQRRILNISEMTRLHEVIAYMGESISLMIGKQRAKKHAQTDLLVPQILEHMRAHLDNPDYSASDAGEAFCLSASYLSKRVKAETGRTFREHLANLRMEEARRLLAETKMPVAQISQNVGILNANYFYLLFKKSCGCTPTDYRKNVAEREKDS